MFAKDYLGRAAKVGFLALAGIECYLFFGMAGAGLLAGLHLGPSDPIPGGPPPDYGPQHASLHGLVLALALGCLGLPAALGMIAVLDKGFPLRRAALIVGGAGMLAVLLFSTVFVASGWTLS